MKKKFLIPTMVFAASFLAAGIISTSCGVAGVESTPSITRVGAKKVSNSASSWVVSNGDAGQLGATEIEGGVQISNLHAYSAEMRLAEKVTLDGLTFTFKNVGASTAAAGFYFSQNTDYAWSKPTFMVWHSLYSGQSRLQVGPDHDYNEPSIAHVSPDNAAETGFGVASSMVMNALENDGFNITFEHTSYSWWKVTITEVFGSSFWGSNANYTKNEETGYASVVTYLKNEDMPIDAEGKAYLHVIGASNAGGTVTVTDFADGTFKEVPEDPASAEEIAAAKATINQVSPADFPASIQETVANLQTAALAEIDTKTKVSEFNEVITAFNNAVHAAYAQYAKYDTPITEQDPAANYEPAWGQEFYSRRLDDRGAVTINMTGTYGARGQLLRSYDYSNFEARINLLELPNAGALFLNFDPENWSYYSAPTKHYTIEFLRKDATHVLAIVSNTSAHNVSVDDWRRDAVGDYNGRLITTSSGTIDISVVSADGNTTITINGESATLPSTVINNGEALPENPRSYVQIGGLNYNGRMNIPVEKFEDAEATAYADGLAATVAAIKARIEGAVATAADAVPAEGIKTDEEYAAYKAVADAAIESINEAVNLTDYDKAYYGIAEKQAAAIATINAPADPYFAAVAAAKADAIAVIDGYHAEDYREEDTYVLAAAQAQYKTAIEEATTLTGVATIIEQAVATLDAIPTDAQLTLEETKTAAKDEITRYVNLEDYRDEQMTEVLAIINTTKTKIDEAADADAVAAAVSEGKAAIDLIKTDAELTAEEAAKALAEAKAAAKTELEGYVNPADYRDAEKAEITTIVTEGKAAIDAATDEAGVASALADAKARLDALKTNAEYTAEEEAKALADAKTAAKAEIEGYIASTDEYDENGIAEIASIVDSTKAAIDAATDQAGVAAALADGKTALDGVAKKAKGCGGSIVAGASVVAMVGFLGLAIAAKRKKED